jgi:anti-anti-sigma regulatory factor
MANNFRADILRKDQSCLYIRVAGDLDGSSAYRLINLIEKDKHNINKIMIDTNALRRVHAFGSDLLEINMRALKNNGMDVVFIGPFKRALTIE